eukprot:1366833-Amorphochlora_amoeboformis.AAC.1
MLVGVLFDVSQLAWLWHGALQSPVHFPGTPRLSKTRSEARHQTTPRYHSEIPTLSMTALSHTRISCASFEPVLLRSYWYGRATSISTLRVRQAGPLSASESESAFIACPSKDKCFACFVRGIFPESRRANSTALRAFTKEANNSHQKYDRKPPHLAQKASRQKITSFN